MEQMAVYKKKQGLFGDSSADDDEEEDSESGDSNAGEVYYDAESSNSWSELDA